ncbi:uncharacterized protein [Diabrotica undecimpunctata]|uniref:uncharacterized protein n=1 Tax=Diabrotica undecimpunctata TaxID=50387 RepID=UPI003B63B044
MKAFVSVICFYAVLGLILADEGCEKRIGTICYEDSTYPTDEIPIAYQKLGTKLISAFGRHIPQARVVEKEVFQSCQLCQTDKNFKIVPLSIISNNNERLYVWSASNYPKPVIEISTCSPQAKCQIEDLQDDFGTICSQKTTKINLLVYNSTSKEFQGQIVPYPSSCECEVVNTSRDSEVSL